MEREWDNRARFDSINFALSLLAHDQAPIGLGFRLRHDPTKCPRCKATIAVLELGGIINALEGYAEMVDITNES